MNFVIPKSSYKAISYTRLSREDKMKCEESNSISNQKELIRQFVESYPEIELCSEQWDDGHTGSNFDRPAFKAMMAEVYEGKIDCIIVKDLSRFGREYIEAGRYLEQIFPTLGVRFIAINDNVDTLREGNDDLIIPIKNVMNDAYCRDISVKIRSQQKVKMQNGNFIGPFAHYGYRKASDNKHKLIVDDVAAEIVKEIFKTRINGTSADQIANILNEHGVPGPNEYRKQNGLPYAKGMCDKKGTKWSANAIIRILKNEIYTGIMVQGKTTSINHKLKDRIDKPKSDWVRIPGTHEAIIDAVEFEVVQKVMLMDTKQSQKDKTISLFAGLVFCGTCGSNMGKRIVPTKESYISYFCREGPKTGCVGRQTIKESVLHDIVLDTIYLHIKHILNMQEIIEYAETESVEKKQIEVFRRKKLDYETQVKKYTDLKVSLHISLSSGLIDKSEYREMKQHYSNIISANIKAIEECEKSIKNTLSNKSEARQWMEQFLQHQGVEKLDRRTLVMLVDSIYVYEDNRVKVNLAYFDKYEELHKLLDEPESEMAVV